MEKNDIDESKYVTAEYLARLFNLSVRRVQQLHVEGAFVTEKVKPGVVRYHLIKSLVSLGKYLLARQDSRNVKQRIDLATADLRERQAAKEAIRLKKLKGEVHEARHVKAIMSLNNREIRAAFLALPDRVAPELALCAGVNEIAAYLRKEVWDILRTLATKEYDPDTFARLVEQEGQDIDTEQDDDISQDE